MVCYINFDDKLKLYIHINSTYFKILQLQYISHMYNFENQIINQPQNIKHLYFKTLYLNIKIYIKTMNTQLA